MFLIIVQLNWFRALTWSDNSLGSHGRLLAQGGRCGLRLRGCSLGRGRFQHALPYQCADSWISGGILNGQAFKIRVHEYENIQMKSTT